MRADGNTYLWSYQKTRPSDGKKVEQTVRLGLVAEIGGSAGAWREVGRLNLIEKYILNPMTGQPTFGWLANHYVRDGLPFNKRSGERKSKGAIYCYRHALDDFILPRWANEGASRIKALDVRDWLYSIHDEEDYDWQTVSKIKMVMGQVFSHADMYELETCRNPIQNVLIPGTEATDHDVRVLKPEETLEIVSRLDYSEKILVVLIAVTAVRISEALALRWSHIKFESGHIRIEQAFRLGEITTTKTKSSKANVPMCAILADYLRYWRSQTPYHRDTDFVFASDKLKGKEATQRPNGQSELLEACGYRGGDN
jgi:integrase